MKGNVRLQVILGIQHFLARGEDIQSILTILMKVHINDLRMENMGMKGHINDLHMQNLRDSMNVGPIRRG